MLRAGYGVVIAVLILSAIEAYRIQVSVSRQHLGIYLHYVDQEEVLSTLRRNLWLAGNHVRDSFINVSPDRSEVLHSQLETLKKENQEALEHLDRTARGTAVVPNLRKSLAEHFAVVDPLPQTLVPALQFQPEDFLRRSGIAAEFVEESVADHLPDVVKTCVYRVVSSGIEAVRGRAAAQARCCHCGRGDEGAQRS